MIIFWDELHDIAVIELIFATHPKSYQRWKKLLAPIRRI
uniref:Uncharacterized protein n=1 Tax=Rhizobium rhizogenes TaxID=359 RepID=A0A7S5DSQ4_RHIRH|nr:hypothetical protein pC5.7c_541 [Rhizobium rhizogenes]QCL09577.1 hypothetical protein pC5.8a_85 [Rhizobium rhizogenes]